MSAGVGLLVALLLAGALAAFRAAVAPGSPSSSAVGERSSPRAASTPGVFADLSRGRLAVGGAVGVVVLLATRWVLLAVLVGLLVVLWGRILHDRRADAERVRIEAIAKWLEDLRDTLRSSSVGAEEGLEQVARRPPEAIAVPLQTFVQRRRQGFRTDDALIDLADDLAHPTADAAVAAIRLVIGGSAGAGRLYSTVDALAAAARDEVTARERVDRTRAVYQNSMKRLVYIGGGLVAYLHVAGGDLLDPYSTPTGQMALALPLAMWVGCIAWLRSLCRYELPARARQVRRDASTAVGVTV